MDAPTALAEEKQAAREPGPAVSEHLRVRHNKRGYLMELGVDEVAAVAFADHVDDWHEVEALVKAGCEPNLALEIISERSTGWTL